MVDRMLTSVVYAVIERIPISLLELNTFGHAICALLIYILWWEKPFEVDYPTIVDSQTLWNTCALVWMMNSRSDFAISVNDDYRKLVDHHERLRWLPTVRLYSSVPNLLSRKSYHA